MTSLESISVPDVENHWYPGKVGKRLGDRGWKQDNVTIGISTPCNKELFLDGKNKGKSESVTRVLRARAYRE